MLIDLENIIGVAGYYIDDVTYEIYSFKQKKPRKIKLSPERKGYLIFSVYNEGKRKHIKYHQVIVKVFIDPTYDPKTQDIDHLDHNRQNNSIDNLKVVSRRENHMNRSYYNGKQVEYIDDKGTLIKPETPNAHKFEMLSVDMIELADNCLPFEVVREKEFAPIKNKTGVDSVESAQALLEKNGYKL